MSLEGRNRVTGANADRLHQQLAALASSLNTWARELRAGYIETVAEAVADARANLPSHRAVSDDDLRISVSHNVRAAWVETQERRYREYRSGLKAARELLETIQRDAQRPPLPRATGSTMEKMAAQLEIGNLKYRSIRWTSMLALCDSSRGTQRTARAGCSL